MRSSRSPGHRLRIQLECARVGVEVVLERYGKAGLLGPGTVVGEVEALPDQRVDVLPDRPPFARALAPVLSAARS